MSTSFLPHHCTVQLLLRCPVVLAINQQVPLQAQHHRPRVHPPHLPPTRTDAGLICGDGSTKESYPPAQKTHPTKAKSTHNQRTALHIAKAHPSDCFAQTRVVQRSAAHSKSPQLAPRRRCTWRALPPLPPSPRPKATILCLALARLFPPPQP